MFKKKLKKYHKTIKAKIQTIVLSLGKKMLDKPTALNAAPINLQMPDSILFLRQDGKIGDYIVSSFAFREIKKNNPNIKIGVVCTNKNSGLFKENLFIDHIHLVKEKSISSYYLTGKKIAKQYEVVIDPTVFVRNRDLVLLRMIAAEYNIGYLKSDYSIYNVNIDNPELHFAEVYQEILKKCGLIDINSNYEIPEDSDSNENISYFLEANRLAHYIAVNFFGASRSRKFTKENIIKYLQYFQDTWPNKQIVLLTYPAVTDLLMEISKNFKNVFIYANTTSIFHSIALIKHADLVISPDTAIIHIASGFNKKIIGFYKDNIQNMNHWHPNTESHCDILIFKEDVNEITPNQLPLSPFNLNLQI